MTRYAISPDAATAIQDLIRHRGNDGNEVAVLLAGTSPNENEVILDRVLVPRQEAFQTDRGCGLLIDGGCLNRLGPRIRDQGRRIHGILHSHPDEAYHSPTDAAGVLMRFQDAFSIVIPRFAEAGQLLHDAAAYVFDNDRDWLATDITSFLRIHENAAMEVMLDD